MTLSGTAACVRGVPQIVEEILYNLCDNAVAYNRPGGTVSVTVEDTAEGARVTVADSGIGIPPEAQNRVFERFYRVDKSHSRRVGGTGLGLSIVRDTVRRHGGWITAQRRQPEGSVFTAGFPCETPEVGGEPL